jgi:hypothetical protein
MITINSDNLEVKGHIGTFYVIDETIFRNNKYFLLESEMYGEDAPHVIVDEDGSLILDNIYNGFDDLYDYLEENID